MATSTLVQREEEEHESYSDQSDSLTGTQVCRRELSEINISMLDCTADGKKDALDIVGISNNCSSLENIHKSASRDAQYNMHSLARRKYTFKTRIASTKEKESPLSVKRREAAKRPPPKLNGSWLCCKRARCVNVIDPVISASAHADHLSLSPFQRKLKLISLLQEDGKFRFEGVNVCNNYIMHILSFSDSMISAVVGRPSARALPSAHRAPKYRNGHTKKMDIFLFHRRFSEAVGDKMPHKDITFLPQHEKKDVYEIFCKEALFRNEYGRKISLPTEPYFCRVWDESLPTIKLRPHNMFTKCSTCVFFREELEKVFFRSGPSEIIKSGQRKHWKFVEAERLEYAIKRDLASREPNEYCSIIVDGADQSAF